MLTVRRGESCASVVTELCSTYTCISEHLCLYSISITFHNFTYDFSCFVLLTHQLIFICEVSHILNIHFLLNTKYFLLILMSNIQGYFKCYVFTTVKKKSLVAQICQVTFIYIALLTIQIVTKQLHNIKIGK